jgi:ABC-type multidrug transport system fused ATPase/permease subunit
MPALSHIIGRGTGLSAHEHVSVWGALRQMFRFMSPRRRRQFYAVLALMMVGALAELVALGAVLPFLSLLADPSRLSDMPVLPAIFALIGADGQREQLLAAAALFAATAILAGLVRLQLAWSSQGFVFRLGHDLGVEIQRRILNQPFSYHVSHNTSEIVASLEKVQVLVFNVLLQLMQAATAIVIALFIIGALIWVDPLTAAVSAGAFGAIYAVVSAFTRQRLATNSGIITSAYGHRVQIIQESLGGIRDVIIDNSQPVYLEEFRRVDDQFSRAKATTAFIGAAPRFAIEAVGMVLLAALALVLAEREGGVAGALPVLGALALGAQRLLPLIQQIYYGWTTMAAHRGVAADVLRLLRLPIRDDAVGAPVLPPLRAEGRIAVEEVTFVYAGREEPALDRVSLEIPKGARIALIGQTGSGKSTLADLLMGLLEPTSGRVTVDGTPLLGDARRAWRRNIAHVPQAIFLADTSIARNIAFGCNPDEIDMGRIEQAARRAQLHDFIASLPQGYETGVGERGVRLSGGQRQRLGIARALYKEARVLVLDEATSALDDATEAAVMESFHQLRDEDLTIIMIAHRLSTIAECDIVARLEKGRIAELGSYDEVVGRSAERASA